MYSIMTFLSCAGFATAALFSGLSFCICYVYGSLKSASRTVTNVIHTRLIHTYDIQQLGLCEALKLDNPYTLTYTLIGIPVYIRLLKDVTNCPIRPNSSIAAYDLYERTVRCTIIGQVDFLS